MRFTWSSSTWLSALVLTAVCVIAIGCSHIPGRPGPEPEVPRPDQVLDFATLYKQNCAACHGEGGQHGAALPLANPVYVAIAGEDVMQQIIAKGVPGKLMPPFAKSAGGMLTDQQVTILAKGIVRAWAAPDAMAAQTLLPYRSVLTAESSHGQQAYTIFCARCHGSTGQGTTGDAKTGRLGSIVDASYLALISDQDLRSIILGGLPDRGMPDWRSDTAQPLTDQQATDIVAWLASQRTANPGQPYPTQHP